MSAMFDQVFSNIPEELRKELESDYHEIKHNFALRKFKPSEMGGGHFCETVYRILEWHTDPNRSNTTFDKKVGDFRQLQQKLMQVKPEPHESVRFHIPNALCQIYDIRSKRGAAHKDKDVNPNMMDAMLVVAGADWVMAELVRMLHNVSVDEAKYMVESMTTKKIPLIWEVGDVKRVLSPPSGSLSAKDKVLVLLYSETSNLLTAGSLRQSIEYKNTTNFRNKVLIPLHNAELVHFDRTKDEIILSPKGIKKVEDEIPLEF